MRQRRPGHPSSRPVTRGTREAPSPPGKSSPRALRTPSRASASHCSCAPGPRFLCSVLGAGRWAPRTTQQGSARGPAPPTRPRGWGSRWDTEELGSCRHVNHCPAPAGTPLLQGTPPHFFWKLLPPGPLCWGCGRSGLWSTESSWGRSERGTLLPSSAPVRLPGKFRQSPALPWLWAPGGQVWPGVARCISPPQSRTHWCLGPGNLSRETVGLSFCRATTGRVVKCFVILLVLFQRGFSWERCLRRKVTPLCW